MILNVPWQRERGSSIAAGGMADKQWGHAVIALFGRCWGCASRYRTFTQIAGIKTHSISSLLFVSYYMLNFFWCSRVCHLLCQGLGIQRWDLSKCAET